MKVKLTNLKNDLENVIIKELFKNKSKLAVAIKDQVTDGLDQAIDFSDPNADHVKPNPASDSFLPPVRIAPLHSFTKLRRRAFDILYGKGAKIFQAQEKMRDDALGGTDVTIKMDGKKIKIHIANSSRLVQFLSKGGNPSMLSADAGSIRKEFFAIMTPMKKNYPDWDSVPSDVRSYLGILATIMDLEDDVRLNLEQFGYDYKHEGFSISAITPRKILHASAETMGKGFIKDNLL